MTNIEEQRIRDYASRGVGYRKISAMTGISANTVKTYCRRHKIDVQKAAEKREYCKYCGSTIVRIPQHRQRLFCSDTCRMQYWNSHREEVKHKKIYIFNCSFCGQEFVSLGNPNRKYCSRKCADNAKRKGVADEH